MHILAKGFKGPDIAIIPNAKGYLVALPELVTGSWASNSADTSTLGHFGIARLTSIPE